MEAPCKQKSILTRNGRNRLAFFLRPLAAMRGASYHSSRVSKTGTRLRMMPSGQVALVVWNVEAVRGASVRGVGRRSGPTQAANVLVQARAALAFLVPCCRCWIAGFVCRRSKRLPPLPCAERSMGAPGRGVWDRYARRRSLIATGLTNLRSTDCLSVDGPRRPPANNGTYGHRGCLRNITRPGDTSHSEHQPGSFIGTEWCVVGYGASSSVMSATVQYAGKGLD